MMSQPPKETPMNTTLTRTIACFGLVCAGFYTTGCATSTLRAKGTPKLILKKSPSLLKKAPALHKKAPSLRKKTSRHSILTAVDAVQRHFPQVAFPHFDAKYSYSIINKQQSISLIELRFYLPATHIPKPKELRAKIKAVLQQTGQPKNSCLNINVSRYTSRFTGYKQPLKAIKVDFACG
jgi:hypothetical protein